MTGRRRGPVDSGRHLASGASAEIPRSFRSELTKGEDPVDLATWAGSIAVASGRLREVRLSKWFNLMWLHPIGFVVLLVCVTAEKGLRAMPSVHQFIAGYPGPHCRVDGFGY